MTNPDLSGASPDASMDVPAMTDVQLDTDFVGTIKKSVSLYRGRPALPISLLTLKGPNNLHTAIKLMYHGVTATDTQSWNMYRQTTSVGLGWLLSRDQIYLDVREPNIPGAGTYYLQSGGNTYRLLNNGDNSRVAIASGANSGDQVGSLQKSATGSPSTAISFSLPHLPHSDHNSSFCSGHSECGWRSSSTSVDVKFSGEKETRPGHAYVKWYVKLNKTSGDYVPVGTVVAYAGPVAASLPWETCVGQAFSPRRPARPVRGDRQYPRRGRGYKLLCPRLPRPVPARGRRRRGQGSGCCDTNAPGTQQYWARWQRYR